MHHHNKTQDMQPGDRFESRNFGMVTVLTEPVQDHHGVWEITVVTDQTNSSCHAASSRPSLLVVLRRATCSASESSDGLLPAIQAVAVGFIQLCEELSEVELPHRDLSHA